MNEIKIDMGTFPPTFFMTFSNVFAGDIVQMKHIMVDEKLGAFELHSSI